MNSPYSHTTPSTKQTNKKTNEQKPNQRKTVWCVPVGECSSYSATVVLRGEIASRRTTEKQNKTGVLSLLDWICLIVNGSITAVSSSRTKWWAMLSSWKMLKSLISAVLHKMNICRGLSWASEGISTWSSVGRLRLSLPTSQAGAGSELEGSPAAMLGWLKHDLIFPAGWLEQI